MCIRGLQTDRVTDKSYTYNVTERSFRAHWIPQCGPGNKAAELCVPVIHHVRVDFNIPGHSYSTKIKRERNPPYKYV